MSGWELMLRVGVFLGCDAERFQGLRDILRLGILPFSGEGTDVVLVDFPFDFEDRHRAKNELSEAVVRIVFNEPFSVRLLCELVTVLQGEVNGADDDISTDVARGGIDASKIESEPVISRLAVVVHAHAVPVEPDSTVFVEEVLYQLAVA